MYVPGDHFVICDRCGHKLRRSQARKTWEGLLVCPKDWEPKHPQLSVTAKGDKQSVIDARPDVGSENFISANDVTTTNLSDPDAISYTDPYIKNTTLSAGASAGDKTITLTSVSNVSVYDSIGITLDNNIVQWLPVMIISDSDVTIGGTLDYDAANGSTIYLSAFTDDTFISTNEISADDL
jgi:hypothetical protein